MEVDVKVLILGMSGSGKSTLAVKLAQGLGVEPLHLDTLHFVEGWGERSEEDENRLLADYLDRNESWVIEGNYSSMLMRRRLEEADRVLVLLAPRLVRLGRVIRRWFRYAGSTRPSMAAGCPEKLDLAFVKWVLVDSCSPRRKKSLPRVAELYPQKTRLYRWYRFQPVDLHLSR